MMPALALLAHWWALPARWWQFWLPRSGVYGGIIMAGVIELGWEGLCFARSRPMFLALALLAASLAWLCREAFVAQRKRKRGEE